MKNIPYFLPVVYIIPGMYCLYVLLSRTVVSVKGRTHDVSQLTRNCTEKGSVSLSHHTETNRLINDIEASNGLIP